MRKNSTEVNEEEVLMSKQPKSPVSGILGARGSRWLGNKCEQERKANTRPRGPHRHGQDPILNCENNGKPPKCWKQQNENDHC